ncbi:MAG: prepilin-type N-terminal cleavage/methylation domain-containing protein [Deltaproteobacteria bacterium]
MHRRRLAGFTLIELLVVVVIVAILLAVVVPAVLSRLSPPRPKKAAIAQQPLTVVATEGVRPRITRSDVHVKLGTRPFLDGVDVASEYVATFAGEFTLRADRAEPVELVFDLPPGVTEARDVALLVEGEGGFEEPAEVSYSASSIRWRTALSSPTKVRIRYQAIGRDAFVYDLVGDGRAEVARFVLDVDEAAWARIPADALAPTSQDGRRFEWSFDRLVATRPIRVDLAPVHTPLGRLLALFRFAAFGVLLFGAGFWFTSEGSAPGRLDTFRLPHFALLALDYATFFVLLGVLGLRVELPVALTAASVVALPLLTFHVARVTATGFALTRALPVAVLTYAAVVASVGWPAHRVVVWTVVAVGALVYVTATYRRWSAGRAAHGVVRDAAREAERNQCERDRAQRILDAVRAAADEAVDRARWALDDTARDLALERAEVVRHRQVLRSVLPNGDEAHSVSRAEEAAARVREHAEKLDAATDALRGANESAWAAMWTALHALSDAVAAAPSAERERGSGHGVASRDLRRSTRPRRGKAPADDEVPGNREHAHEHGDIRATSRGDEHAPTHGDEHATSHGDEHATSRGGEHATSRGGEHATSRGGEHATSHGDEHATSHGDDAPSRGVAPPRGEPGDEHTPGLGDALVRDDDEARGHRDHAPGPGDDARSSSDDDAPERRDPTPGPADDDARRGTPPRGERRFRRATGRGERASHTATIPALVDEAEALHARVLHEADAAVAKIQPRDVASRARALTNALTALGARASLERAAPDREGLHCAACGHGLGAADDFCAGCGVPAPACFDCGRCGDQLRVPVHLSRRRWARAPLHCGGCGDLLRPAAAE